MEQDIAFWHYLAGIGLFCTLGLVAHVCRAIVRPATDPVRPIAYREFIGDGERVAGRGPFDSDDDEAGNYRLMSLRNLCNAVALSSMSGLCLMVVSPEAAAVIARFIDVTSANLGRLF